MAGSKRGSRGSISDAVGIYPLSLASHRSTDVVWEHRLKPDNQVSLAWSRTVMCSLGSRGVKRVVQTRAWIRSQPLNVLLIRRLQSMRCQGE